VYAVYATIKYHSRSLGAFLKTREARALLGDLALNPSAHKGELAALREGFLSALDAQEKLVQHGLELGLRADELDFWFKRWAATPGSSLDDMLSELTEYAAGGGKFRSGKAFVTDPESLKHLADYDLRVAGRGGIEHITATTTEAGERSVTIEGRVLDSLDREVEAPNFNKTNTRTGKLLTAKELGLSADDWEIAHLWGPGFGDEAAAGIMMAPKQVNQVWQNKGIEHYIRELGKRARAEGGNVKVTARATSWGSPTPSGWVPPKGADFLQRAEYKITLELPGGETKTIGVTVHVDQPPFKGARAEFEPDDAVDLRELF
jgi:hypothetical protein